MFMVPPPPVPALGFFSVSPRLNSRSEAWSQLFWRKVAVVGLEVVGVVSAWALRRSASTAAQLLVPRNPFSQNSHHAAATGGGKNSTVANPISAPPAVGVIVGSGGLGDSSTGRAVVDRPDELQGGGAGRQMACTTPALPSCTRPE